MKLLWGFSNSRTFLVNFPRICSCNVIITQSFTLTTALSIFLKVFMWQCFRYTFIKIINLSMPPPLLSAPWEVRADLKQVTGVPDRKCIAELFHLIVSDYTGGNLSERFSNCGCFQQPGCFVIAAASWWQKMKQVSLMLIYLQNKHFY